MISERLADRRHSISPLDPAAALKARCEARALLYHAGELTLHEAVDGLQQAAEESGLTQSIGQDAVQHIMADAFAVVRKLEGDRW
jgi:hypothetical protein